ncbi:hypothetical protein LQW54_007799 [Pestalotiopsis sp. IQ-011]
MQERETEEIFDNGIDSELKGLASIQLELFNHYLEHTAKSIAVDGADLDALTIGIRRLVAESRIITNSVLALAAIQKCSAIIKHPKSRIEGDHAQVEYLLHAAEQYHWQTLQQAPTDAGHMSRYDHVMANAALMVLYSCAGHSVRISLMGTNNGGNYRSGAFRPGELQWVSMIRAIQMAYSGLATSKPKAFAINEFDDSTKSQICRIDTPSSLTSEFDLSGASGPRPRTGQLFFPIVAATWHGALDRLHASARLAVQKSRETDSVEPDLLSEPARSSPEYQMCISALHILKNIFQEIFLAPPLTPPPPPKPNAQSEKDEIAKLEPWLRDYLARVTSKTRHKPLRRAIMAFVHRLPSGYIELVQSALKPEGIPLNDERLRLQRLAVDIFAHWLVLVMLLDCIWWIGDVGSWELEHAISAMRSQRHLDGTETLDCWWPQSMYITKLEIDRHDVRDLD